MYELFVSEVETDEEVGQHEEGPKGYALVVKDGFFPDTGLLVTFRALKEMELCASTTLHTCDDCFALDTSVGFVKNSMLLKELNLQIWCSYLVMKSDNVEVTHFIL